MARAKKHFNKVSKKNKEKSDDVSNAQNMPLYTQNKSVMYWLWFESLPFSVGNY